MNKKGRTIFIWDIHWCYDELKLLIKRLDIKTEDKVYCVWDLINKWPKSFKVVKFLYKNQEQYRAVIGNHEIDFLRWVDWDSSEKCIKSYKELKKKIETKKPELMNFIRWLPKYIEWDNFILIHGGLIPNKELKDHSEYEIAYLREYEWRPWYSYYNGEKKIIYWHWVMDWLQIREKTIWLDSGCVYGWFLSAYILETNEIIWQKALAMYSNPYSQSEKLNILQKIKHFIKWK
jgi:hypothetical protein